MRNNTTKKQFVKMISEHSNVPQYEVKEVLSGMCDALQEFFMNGNDGDCITYPGNFVIKIKTYSPRKARNPRTGEKFITEPRKALKFEISKKLTSGTRLKDN